MVIKKTHPATTPVASGLFFNGGIIITVTGSRMNLHLNSATFGLVRSHEMGSDEGIFKPRFGHDRLRELKRYRGEEARNAYLNLFLQHDVLLINAPFAKSGLMEWKS